MRSDYSTHFHDQFSDTIKQIKLKSLLPILIVVLAVLVCLASFNFYQGLHSLGLVLTCFGILPFCISIFLIKFFKAHQLASWICCLGLILGHPINVYMTNGVQSPTIIWMFNISATVFFLLEFKKGIWITLSYYLLIAFACYLSAENVLTIEINPIVQQYKYRVAHFSMAGLFALSFFYLYAKMLTTVNAFKNALLKENQQLLSILCHDITSPAIVINYLANKNISSRMNQETLLNKVNTSSAVILDIIKNVKNLRSIGLGQEINLVEVDLGEVLQKVSFLFEDKLIQKEMVLEWCFGGHEKIILHSNESILTNNVISNLVSNSIKYSKQGTRIKIRVVKSEAEAEISINDQGIGIPKAVLDYLFKHPSIPSRIGLNGEKGAGMGLSIVNYSLEKLRGKILVESKTIEDFPEDHGTEYKIILPTSF